MNIKLITYFKASLIALGFLLSLNHSFSQERFKELFTFYPNKHAAAKDSALYKSKLVVAPVVTYAPETSFGFGIGSKFLFKFKGAGDETRTSNMPFSAKYTLKNQFIFYSGFEVLTNHESWVIFGELRFQNYPRSFFGIGRHSEKSDEEKYSYSQLLVQPLVMKRVLTKYLFVGGGIRHSNVFGVKVKPDGILETTEPKGYEGTRSTGAELGFLYDSRDNILTATKGWYVLFTHGFYDKFLGGQNQFKLTRFDIRHYIKMFNSSNDIFGIQLMGYFSHGNVPFPELALFGGQNMMRGYKEGRFVEENMLATQIEYRKTFKNSRWGVVGFLGCGDVYKASRQLKISEIKPNIGLGVRYMIDTKEKLNIRFDWGFGRGSNNTYLNISEAF